MHDYRNCLTNLRANASRPTWPLVLIAALALAASPGLLRAQVGASISGEVLDASGGGVDGATVTVKSLETGATRVAATNNAGEYLITSLPVGPQEVRAEKKGFQTAVRTGVDLQVGQDAVVSLQLAVGEITQELTVSGAPPVVNTTTDSISGMVGERQVKDLPLNGRSFDNLITLNPGAINYTLKSANTSTSNGYTFSVEGRRPMDNLVLLNGIEYTGSSQLAITPGGASGLLLGIDAVREFNVLTNAYGAQYGKRAGAQVAVVTQSGTNAVHGTVFEFIRNSALDARNFFDQGNVPPFRRNQFGGALGGPIKKNKLFLFGNYEGFRQSLAVSNVAVVPDDQARLGLLPNSSGVYKPVHNLNPAMLPYMSFWPEANGPELYANGLPSGTALSYENPKQSIREDFGTTRADYAIRDQDTLSAAYTIDDGNSLIPLADPLFGSYSTLRMQVGSVEETHIVSPDILNTFRAGFSRAAFSLDSSLLSPIPSSLSFVDGAGPGGIVIGGGVTTTGLAALTSAGPNNAAGVWNRRNLYTYADSLQIDKGIHQISIGVWFQRVQDNEDSASRQLGQATFTSLTTFLQGTVSSFQVVPKPNELGWRSFFGAWYAQDAIKLRPNLTVQLGVRHEFTNGWNEASGRAANYITAPNGVLQTNPAIGDSVFTQNNAKLLLSPRASFAWDPFGNGKTAVRGGIGVYYSLIDDLSFLLNSLPPYNGALTYTGALSSFAPISPNTPPPPPCGPGVPKPCATYAPQGVQPNAQTPAVTEWNLTVERQLDHDTSFSVAYVASHGYHQLISVDPNTIPAQICASESGCQSGGIGSVTGLVPQGAQYIPVGKRPNPYLGAGFFWYTEGKTSYNALQVDVNHRWSKGLQFRGNYTWSKSLDMNSGLTGAQSNNQAQMILNRNDPMLDWGPSALNAANQAGLSASYDLPFGHRNRLVTGWQVNGIVTLLSGFPFTPQIGSSRSGDGDTRNPDRPNLNTSFSGPIVLGNPNQWFNPNAFSLPVAGTYGDLGRGVFSGPGLATADVSLLKTTSIAEWARLQFRAEFFNVLNRANFASPNATVFANGTVSASAGLITSTATTSRQIQFGLKLIF